MKKAQTFMFSTIFAVVMLILVAIIIAMMVYAITVEKERNLDVEFSTMETQVLLDTFLQAPLNLEQLSASATYADLIRAFASGRSELAPLVRSSIGSYFINRYDRPWTMKIDYFRAATNTWEQPLNGESYFGKEELTVDEDQLKGVQTQKKLVYFGTDTEQVMRISYQYLPGYRDSPTQLIRVTLITREQP